MKVVCDHNPQLRRLWHALLPLPGQRGRFSVLEEAAQVQPRVAHLPASERALATFAIAVSAAADAV